MTGPRPPVPLYITPADRFAATAMTADQLTRVAAIRAAFALTMGVVEISCDNGRERSLVTTALEEACMWAVKAISREPKLSAAP